jgi:hypothetical protein
MHLLRAVIPTAAATTGILVAGALYALGCHEAYQALLHHWGALPFRSPFLDIHAVTSAVECHRLGFDVYKNNPCDVFQRVHGYSPVWLWLAIFPITTAWDTYLGITTILLFLSVLPLLPPGRGWWQTAAITLATISSVVAYAVERANVDLLIFVLAMIAITLNCRCAPVRLLGYSAVLVAGMLKFYPVSLMILAVRERLMVFLTLGFVVLSLIALWLVLDGTDILRGIANIPTTSYFDDNIFGVRDLPFGVIQRFGFARWAAIAVLVALLVGMLCCAVALAMHNGLASRVRLLTKAEATCLLAGCVLLVGSFLGAQNSLYRAIFLLFVLPGLTVVYPGVVPVIILLMWSSGIRAFMAWVGLVLPADGMAKSGIWMIWELAWWFVVAMLLAVMFRLVWESPARQDASRLMIVPR